jgi:type IV pilus assembly protein PilE
MNRHLASSAPPTASGYTVIELLITVTIIGILASIAYPSYRAQVMQTRRAEMQAELLAIAQYFERRHAETGCYNAGPDANCATAGDAAAPPFRTTFDHYTVAIEGTVGPDSFLLKATPTGTQAGDGALLIDHAQRRFWDENNNGDHTESGEDDWARN